MLKHPKALGQLLLLIAFVAQMLFLDTVRDTRSNIDNAHLGYIISRLSADLYLSMYLDSDDNVMLKRAARELTDSASVASLIVGRPKKDAADAIVALRSAAATVNDLDTYNSFIDRVNSIERENNELAESYRKSLRTRERLSWAAVFFASFFGLFLIWRGEAAGTSPQASRAERRRNEKAKAKKARAA